MCDATDLNIRTSDQTTRTEQRAELMRAKDRHRATMSAPRAYMCAFLSAAFAAQYFFVRVWFASVEGWPRGGIEFPPFMPNEPGRDDASVRVTNNRQHQREVEYIPTDQLIERDIFSAAWWQHIPRFLELDVEKYVQNVESDAFKPVLRAGRGFDDARLTRDWLDFSVEHLSKWWKMGEQPATYAFAVGKLQSYIQRTLMATTDNGVHDTTMESTLALIPYGVSDKTEDIGQQMWMISLAATIASLIQHGVARVLVVGYYDADAKQAREAFEYLLDHDYHGADADEEVRIAGEKMSRIKGNGVGNSPFSTKWGNTELAFVHTSDIKSK